MSFAGGDASCSAGANPMTQMLKQFGQDRSLQQVMKRLVGVVPIPHD